VKINIEVERKTDIAAPPAQVLETLKNLDATLKRFPKLRKLTPLGACDYRLDMQTIGSKIANIAHDASFGARCVVDETKGEIRWTPIPKVGNAQIEGLLRIKAEGSITRLSFRVRGELHDVPVPLMYRLVAPAFIQGKFTALVDAYLERTSVAVTGNASQAPA